MLNAANEVAVAHFLSGLLSFSRIPEVIEGVLADTDLGHARDLEEILAADAAARARAERKLARTRPFPVSGARRRAARS